MNNGFHRFLLQIIGGTGETHQLNYYTKKLHIASFLKLLLFAQLNETESLRAVSDTLFSDDLQKATDLESISFSQLGRRLNQVPTDVFQADFSRFSRANS